MTKPRSLIIRGARQNNLKNLDIEIPHNQLTVVTGPSGSGKSSLAFDTIFAEGQRLYVESLSTYARQFLERIERPDVDHIENICPTIAIEQKNRVKNSRSTVGTSTEIYDYMRLLYAKIGILLCPNCGTQIKRNSISNVVDFALKKLKNQKLLVIAPFLTHDMTTEALVKELLRKGFSRILLNNELVDLHDKPKMGRKPEIWVVLDRLVVKNDIKEQLSDSLEIAYQETKGKAILQDGNGEIYKFSSDFICSQCDIKAPEINPSFFSFNNPYGACTLCKGFGNNLEVDEDLVIPNPKLTLEEGAIDPWTKPSLKRWEKRLFEFIKKEKISKNTPYRDLAPEDKKKLFEGAKGFKGIVKFFKQLERKKYKMSVRVFLSRYKSAFQCTKCLGKRLRPETANVKLGAKTIAELHAMTVEDIIKFFNALKLTPFEQKATKEVMSQIRSRLSFLSKVGLDYLHINRLTRTLSGGEAQRINLASQLGAQLMQTMYVLDEPSIGLHPRDTKRLIGLLKNLRDLGNTVIIVEHDPDLIRSADFIIELGPMGGEHGGKLQFQGPYKQFLKSKTLTASYMNYTQKIAVPKKRRPLKGLAVTLRGVTHNNLKSVDLHLPLNQFVCITGVSGSGKSSLIHETLYNALARIFKFENKKIGRFKTISGFNRIKGVRLLDQAPIGRSPRSNPVTYMKAFDDIRKTFAATSQSKKLGYTTSTFSFNVSGGRCETCQGEGFQKIEMHFMADLYLTCEICDGKRYKKEVLDVFYKGKNIHEVLSMTVDDAYEFFMVYPGLRKKLKILQEVGLGYLKLGQPATTLSGGEAQRLKISKELARDTTQYLYFLDEPTTGLHLDDIKKLLVVLDELINRGNTVVVIEHNLDVIKTADTVIDLGPEGGKHGGEIIAIGTPEEVALIPESHTGRFLKKILMPLEN